MMVVLINILLDYLEKKDQFVSTISMRVSQSWSEKTFLCKIWQPDCILSPSSRKASRNYICQVFENKSNI